MGDRAIEKAQESEPAEAREYAVLGGPQRQSLAGQWKVLLSIGETGHGNVVLCRTELTAARTVRNTRVWRRSFRVPEHLMGTRDLEWLVGWAIEACRQPQ